MKTTSRYLTIAALLVLLQSCATPPAPVSYFDFGALPPTADTAIGCELPPINVADITSPGALDSNLMLYRLLYANDQQSHAYANHRWGMTPAQLMALRIKSRLARANVRVIDNGLANPDGWQLRLDLDDFGQYFSDATHSYAQLQLRVTILRGNRLIAQTTLTRQSIAAAPDAPSGAKAMRVAGDALISDLNDWLCKQPHP